MKAQPDDDAAAGIPADSGRGAATYLGIGLLVGILLAVVVLWVWRGNPFSAANEVRYREVVVGSVGEDEDSICWAEDPDRRDSPQQCAILALDPELEVPESGDRVTIGVVDLSTPDGAERTQVVHVGPAEAGGGGAGSEPTPSPEASPEAS